jgi:hypothetical protein
MTDTLATWGGWAPAIRDDPFGHFADAKAQCPVQKTQLADGHPAWIVLVCLGSANRDPDRFPAPARHRAAKPGHEKPARRFPFAGIVRIRCWGSLSGRSRKPLSLPAGLLPGQFPGQVPRGPAPPLVPQAIPPSQPSDG